MLFETSPKKETEGESGREVMEKEGRHCVGRNVRKNVLFFRKIYIGGR